MTIQRSTLFTGLLAFLFAGTVHSQSVQTNGPADWDLLTISLCAGRISLRGLMAGAFFFPRTTEQAGRRSIPA